MSLSRIHDVTHHIFRSRDVMIFVLFPLAMFHKIAPQLLEKPRLRDELRAEPSAKLELLWKRAASLYQVKLYRGTLEARRED